MNVTRMDLADAGSPDKIVKTILEIEPDLPIPVPIEELCKQLDIHEIVPLTTDGFEGGLITDPEKSRGVVLYNEKSPYQRRRFTIGHELGHFLIPSHLPVNRDQFMCSRDDMNVVAMTASDRRKRMEAEANRFAALILMPPTRFKKDVNQRREADLSHILELAVRYETSKEATGRWYIQYRQEPCALVVGHQGKILRYYKGFKFPFIEPEWGDPIPSLSNASGLKADQGSISGWHSVNPSAWISVKRGERAPELLEQVLSQRDGFSLTLLELQAPDEDDAEDESEIERSWRKPRFAYGR